MLEQQFADVMVGTTSTFTEKMQDFKTMESMMNAMSGLTMLVGGIVMMNAMLMSVFERTQEIGLLRAVGWKRKRVVGMIVIEGLALSLFSGVAGVGIGIGLNSILGLIPLYGSFFNPIYEGPTFLQIGVLVLVLGVVGSMWVGTDYAPINPLGMFIGAIIMFGVLGFLPGWILAKILHAAGKLRIPRDVELAGLDYNIMEQAQKDERAVASSNR